MFPLRNSLAMLTKLVKGALGRIGRGGLGRLTETSTLAARAGSLSDALGWYDQKRLVEGHQC